MAIQEFDFSTGKVLDPNRKQAIILSASDEDREVLSEAVRRAHFRLLDSLSDLRKALALIAKHKVGVLFLDSGVEGVDAMGIMANIRKSYPDFNIVIVLETATKELIGEAQRNGAAGILLQPLSAEAVDKVLARIK